MTVVSLRAATEADLPALISLGKRSWLSAFEGSAPKGLVEFWRALDREPTWYAQYWPTMTVAERSGALVGVVQPLDDEVNGLWVDPAAQRTGVGPVLLRSAERQIADAGHHRAWITCSGFNAGALRFYLREGYRETRRVDKEITPGLVDRLVILERSFENQ